MRAQCTITGLSAESQSESKCHAKVESPEWETPLGDSTRLRASISHPVVLMRLSI